MKIELLHYRQWQGTVRRPAFAIWPIARVALGMLLRRKLFWALYSISLIIFAMFFFGGFLLDWALTQAPTDEIKIGTTVIPPDRMIRAIRRGLEALNGGQATFAYFFRLQSEMVMIILAFTGALLVGKDYLDGSVPFFLSKPISRWHYIGGKCLAAGIVVHMLTTLPALILFAQHGLSEWQYVVDPDYFTRDGGRGPAGLPLLLGVIGYGMLLSVVLSIMVIATASWVRRTMPLVMVWTAGLLFLDLLTDLIVDDLNGWTRWRLLSMWNNFKLTGRAMLGYAAEEIRPQPQPATWEAALVIFLVCFVCLIYLNRRTRAIEIVK